MMRFSHFRFSVRRGMAFVVGFALLTAILKPVIEAQQEEANKARCKSNLMQLGVALHQYYGLHDAFPSGLVGGSGLTPNQRMNWIVPLWPQRFDTTRLDVDLKQAWDAPANWPPKMTLRGSFAAGSDPVSDSCGSLTCPNERSRGKGARSNLSYVGIAGLGPDAAILPKWHERAGVFGYDRVVNYMDIKDGLSNTILLAETTSGVGPFTAGGASGIRPVDPKTRPHLGRGRAFGGYHPGGANVLMCDGSVKFARETIAHATFESLATIAGAEVIPGDCTCK